MMDDTGDDCLTIDHNQNDPNHNYIRKNRILKIVTPDDKVWENPPVKERYSCRACGFTTTDPKKYGYRCPKPENECWGWNRGLKRAGSSKF